MLYNWESTAALAAVRDEQTADPLTLAGEGLWVCLLSSGSCAAALGDAPGSLPALPPYVHVLAANERGLALLRGSKKPAGASLARLARENDDCRAAAAAHAAAADLAALCRRIPGPMGGCYTQKPVLLR